MIALTLLTVAASAIGWNMHRMIAKKRFTANVERLRSRFSTCRRLALNCQADWRCALIWNGKSWILQSRCIDSPDTQALPSTSLDSFSLFMDEEEKKSLTFDFTATGEIIPRGTLKLRQKQGELEVEWKIPDIFSLEEGESFGPVHPYEA